MMEQLIGTIPNRIRTTLDDPSFSNNWAQVRSKRLLASIAPEAILRLNYTYSASRIVRNATSTLQSALVLLEAGHSLEELTAQLKRAAEAMEYLADLGEGALPSTSRLIAAGLYQLAGYEANSLCLARSIPIPELPRPEAPGRMLGAIERWALLAIQRRFLQLLVETVNLERRLPELEQVLLAGADRDELHPDQLAVLPALAVASRSFRLFASASLEGPRAETDFFESCRQLDDILLRTGKPHSLLYMRAFEAVARLLFQHSLWHLLDRQVTEDPVWHRFVVLSARGRAANMLAATGRVELWESQRRALAAGLLDGGHAGFSIRMPTSAGKTRIAELSILRSLTSAEGRKAIYVAPFKALADEMEASLAPTLADLGYRVSAVPGGFEVDDLETQLFGAADLLIATPEKLALLLRNRPEFFENVGLVVLDEGHLIEDRERGARYEILLTQLRRKMPQDAQFLVMSAVVSHKNAADFAEWLCSNREAVVQTEWRPTRQLVGIFNAENGRITYPREGPVGGAGEPFVMGAAQPHTYVDFTAKLRREKALLFPSRTKGELTAELAIIFADQGPVLVFTTNRNWAESLAQTVSRGIQLRRQTPGSSIPAVFSDPDSIAKKPQASLEVAEQWLGPESLVPRLLRQGIGIHHAGLPEAVRRAIEDDFRRERIGVLAATSTLAQGVNLPVKTVLVHSVTQHINGRTPDDDGENITIDPRDFWNIAGRAGRAVAETEGHVILVASNNWEANQLRVFLGKEPADIRGRLFGLLEELTHDRLPSEQFRYQLDSELLSIMVEEAVGTNAEARFEEVLQRSFVHIQARDRLDIAPLRQRALQAIGEIMAEVADPDLRSVFARTGFDVNSCLVIVDRIQTKSRLLKQLLAADDIAPATLVREILADIVNLPQMVVDYTFVGDLDELASDWIGQIAMPDLVARHLTAGSDERKFHKFMADFFGYRLPWGVGAYVQLARHVLAIADDLGEVARWLPSMVRYGVPTAKATWAMTLGCPSRELSASIAIAFMADTGGHGDYATFVDWFSAMTEEDFVLRLGATASEAQVLMRRSNALVPSNRQITASLRAAITQYDTMVAGLAYDNRHALLPLVHVGMVLSLRRDYLNAYDSNTIAVLVGENILGYVPRPVARLIAPQMDAGLEVAATVRNVAQAPLAIDLHLEVRF